MRQSRLDDFGDPDRDALTAHVQSCVSLAMVDARSAGACNDRVARDWATQQLADGRIECRCPTW